MVQTIMTGGPLEVGVECNTQRCDGMVFTLSNNDLSAQDAMQVTLWYER
jgi:hypothetical protein